jgi:LAS superfamily LD-carboxypeptidase LdcB
MKRSAFLKTSFYSLIGLSVLPHFSFRAIQDNYTLEQLIGKGNPDIVGDSYTTRMHKETAIAFQKMKTEAAKSNIDIELVSSYRSFQRQREIFEGKYQRFTAQGLSPEAAIKKIIEYSTIPGTSRHHWGTDIDIIDRKAPRPASVLQSQHFHGEGPFCKLKEWLDENSESFGFYEVYTDDPMRKGFKYEPWHFSYAPVSIPMLKEYRKLNIKAILQKEKIKGSEYFTDAFMSNYISENVLDINPKLL